MVGESSKSAVIESRSWDANAPENEDTEGWRDGRLKRYQWDQGRGHAGDRWDLDERGYK